MDIKELLSKEIISTISLDNLAVLLTQFSLLSYSNVPIVESLEILQEGSNVSVKNMLGRVKAKVESGRSLSEALGEEKFNSSDLLSSMVASGEMSGSLPKTLKLMADYYKRKSKNKKEIQGELIYPLLVALVSLGVVMFTIIFIMPTYQDMFAARGEDLPLITRLFFGASSFLKENLVFIALTSVIGILSLIILYKKIPSFKYNIDKISSKIPLIMTYRLTSLYVYSSTCLAILTESKVPILKIIAIIKIGTSNLYYKERLGKIEKSLELGEEVHKSFDSSGLFSSLYLTMLKTGERSGNLSHVMAETSLYYSDKLRETIKYIAKLIGPLIILLMSFIVAIIVFSVTMPMFDIINMI